MCEKRRSNVFPMRWVKSLRSNVLKIYAHRKTERERRRERERETDRQKRDERTNEYNGRKRQLWFFKKKEYLHQQQLSPSACLSPLRKIKDNYWQNDNQSDSLGIGRKRQIKKLNDTKNERKEFGVFKFNDRLDMSRIDTWNENDKHIVIYWYMSIDSWI